MQVTTSLRLDTTHGALAPADNMMTMVVTPFTTGLLYWIPSQESSLSLGLLSVGWITGWIPWYLTALKSVTKWHIQSTATLVLLETGPASSSGHANVPGCLSIPLTKPNSKICFSSNHTPNYSRNSHTEENPSAFVLHPLPAWAALVSAVIYGSNCNSPEKIRNALRAHLVTTLSAFCS